jgi:hypothetical protein
MSIQDQYPSYAHPYSYQLNVQQPLPTHLYYPFQSLPYQQQQGDHHHHHHHHHHHPTHSNNNSTAPDAVTNTTTLAVAGSHYGSYMMNPKLAAFLSPPSDSRLTKSTRQIQFSAAPIIHSTWTPEQYDRTSDPQITAHRLTPAIAHNIKKELNQFKSQEMMVHQDSRIHTHFFL